MPNETSKSLLQDPDDMPEIRNVNGIHNDLVSTSNDRLKKTVQELRRLGSLIGEMIEQERETTEAEKKAKDALDNLTSTIKKLDAKNGTLQLVIVILTVATVALAFVQILIAIRPPRQPQPQVIIKEIPQIKK